MPSPIELKNTPEGLHPQEIKSKNSCNLKPWIVGIVGTIAVIGLFTALYFGNTSFNTFVNTTFSHIPHGQMSVAEGFLCMGLPVAGAAFLLTLAIYIYRRTKKRADGEDFYGEGKLKELKKTLKEIAPTRKQLMIGALVLAILAVAALLLYLIPATHQWFNQSFSQKIQIWEAIVYIGGGTAVRTALVIGLCYLIAKIWKKVGEAYKKNTPSESATSDI